MTTLSIAEIRSASARARERKIAVVHVPEWGGDITLRQMSAAQYFDVCASLPKGEAGSVELSGGENVAEFYIRVILACAVDFETGKPIFSAEDAEILRESPQVIALLGPEAMRINGLTADPADAASAGASAKN